MTHRKRFLGASTALVTLIVALPQQVAAQTIPPCNDAAEARDAAEVDDLGGVTLDRVPALLESGAICMLPNGKVRVTGNAEAGVGAAPEAAGDSEGDAAAEAEAEGETEAEGEAEAAAEAEAEAAAEAAAEAEAEVEAEAEAEAEAAAPDPEAEGAASSAVDDVADTVEGLADALGEDGDGSGEAPAEAPADEAEPDRDTADTEPDAAPEPEPEPEPEAEPEPDVAETAPESDTAEPEPETPEAPQDDEGGGDDMPLETLTDTLDEAVPGVDIDADTEVTAETPEGAAPSGDDDPGRPADVAAAENEQPVETTETVMTEENTRSSDEDFAEDTPAPDAEASGDGDRDGGGLSAFEKFAVGAAGIAVLSQIIGDDEEVVSNTGDRVVVQRDDGSYYVLKDDDELLRRPGADVRTETFADGSTRTTVTRQNGVQVVTISAADGTVLRRTKVFPDGRQVVLFDDTQTYEPVDVSRLPRPAQSERVEADNSAALRAALQAERARDVDRTFSLAQVRHIREVRELMPEIDIDAINFATGSAAIRPEEAEDLYALGEAMSEFIAENPDELFLIEGHTDAVGGAAMNLALSDRRAESVALALTEYFDVPPENMVVQGYGERFLKVPTQEAERINRRATVRRITPLVQVASR
ncbi:OmpA family protein [Psychromarinibacter sp. C21-152]|uniref:OmpA family protein n=1 Tax=Psychromarinibacter sediminicola TaxID=3033385 RepID=A0AAE3T8E2_9RHOB|nr:OmpA family protein [Psychromarinibacter sediminicola]MDF0600608.1 OmpA family protein [Psychromarinibacter sediminicola]